MPEYADTAPFMRTPLTEEQADDLRRCYQEWLSIREKHGFKNPPSPADIAKSALLGRMTMDGHPPMFSAPPRHYSRPWWELVEGNGALLDAIEVEGPFGQGRILNIRQDSWQIEVIGGDYYILTHNRLVGNWTLRHRTVEDPLIRKGTTVVDGEAFPLYYTTLDWILEGPK